MRSTGFAYAVPLFFPFKMAFWSRFMGNVALAGPPGVGVSAIQSWKVILHASRSHQLQWGCKKTTKTPETSRKHIGVANGNCFLQGNLEVCLGPNLSSWSTTGFYEHFLSVSAAEMLFSRLVVVMFSVFFSLSAPPNRFLSFYSSGFPYFLYALCE